MPAYLAGNVGRVGARLLLRVLEQEGLSINDHAVLVALRDFGPLAQHELADRLDVDRSQVVGFVDRLEREGCVTRSRDPSDRRRVLVSLTTEGRTTERRMTAAAHRSQATMLSALSPSEQAELVALLQRVLDAHDETRLDLTAP
ncbi:MarR family transcriptional regulator [Amycolatopsis sp. RM579]|uniref:MarR family transcriptional regulator n=2 Tax=Amycolatopsis pithecellobii TaxID=664692 RepID=A0A6N7YQX3_9PSEU|nr:MarR family transcriptional regulator [Amycolatopsis pithecellobii]